jgi:hypothetical protein
MAANIDAIPLITQASPAEASHGRQGHSQDAKHIAAYQQAAAHAPTRETSSTGPAVHLSLSRTDKTDKDGEGQSRDAHHQSQSQNGAGASEAPEESNGPAATISISPAARAAIAHQPKL